MSRLCRFFVLIIVAYTAAGCTPLGSIGGAGAVDFLLAVPEPNDYRVEGTFKPIRDLKVWISSQNGTWREISLVQTTITIFPPFYTPAEVKVITYDTAYPLKKTGDYVIVVEYLALTASCYIKVLSPDGTGTAGFIEIIWVDE